MTRPTRTELEDALANVNQLYREMGAMATDLAGQRDSAGRRLETSDAALSTALAELAASRSEVERLTRELFVINNSEDGTAVLLEAENRRLTRERDQALVAMERAQDDRDQARRVAAEKTQAEFERNELRAERDSLSSQLAEARAEAAQWRTQVDHIGTRYADAVLLCDAALEEAAAMKAVVEAAKALREVERLRFPTSAEEFITSDEWVRRRDDATEAVITAVAAFGARAGLNEGSEAK